MAAPDPFQSSLMARPSYTRLVLVSGVIVGLWIAVLWAVALA